MPGRMNGGNAEVQVAVVVVVEVDAEESRR